jgi:hypothetical protein
MEAVSRRAVRQATSADVTSPRQPCRRRNARAAEGAQPDTALRIFAGDDRNAVRVGARPTSHASFRVLLAHANNARQ